jgi:hypothetical protein
MKICPMVAELFHKSAKKWTEVIFYVISQEEISKQWKSEKSQATQLQTSNEFLNC